MIIIRSIVDREDKMTLLAPLGCTIKQECSCNVQREDLALKVSFDPRRNDAAALFEIPDLRD